MENNNFCQKLTCKLFESLVNNYEDNWDYLRFGKKQTGLLKIKELFRKYFTTKKTLEIIGKNVDNVYEHYNDKFTKVYNLLSDTSSKSLYVELIAYRILGYRNVKLSVNNAFYWDCIEKAKSLIVKNNFFKAGDKNIPLFDLKKIGVDIKLYFVSTGIAIDFLLEQYTYKNKEINIGVKKGDVVIDAGGGWGDTALCFANKVGIDGKVYTFEFISSQIKILNKNIELNPHLASRIEIIKIPIWDKVDEQLTFVDNGSGSKLDKKEAGNNFTVTTTTIDYFVKSKKIEKVDFLKMDIEGVELNALSGAQYTIQKFKPTLAISIYHSMEDMVQIPLWIDELKLGYKFYIGHYTIHSEETVLYAIAN